MIPEMPRLTTYLGLMIGIAYILLIGPVYALLQEASGAASAPCRTNQNVTVPLIAQMQTNLVNAKQADKSGNTTLAVGEIQEAQEYLNDLLNIYRYLCRP